MHEIKGKSLVWESPPIIVNCIKSFKAEKRINESVVFWDQNGYVSYIGSTKYLKSACEQERLEGFILIKRAKKENLGPLTLAYTEIFAKYGIIDAAVIYISRGNFYYPFLLEHEIGHAFGIMHIEEDGNIMNPIYDNLGRNF